MGDRAVVQVIDEDEVMVAGRALKTGERRLQSCRPSLSATTTSPAPLLIPHLHRLNGTYLYSVHVTSTSADTKLLSFAFGDRNTGFPPLLLGMQQPAVPQGGL